MKTNVLTNLIVLVCIFSICGMALALDEAVLTPTKDSAEAVVAEEDKAFNYAMSIWLKHKYEDGAKLLREFAAKHPDSRWRAEAEMHRGCYLTYPGRVGDGAARKAGLG